MDEVGRGTSPREGMGVAHAIAEELIRTKASCSSPLLLHALTTLCHSVLCLLRNVRPLLMLPETFPDMPLPSGISLSLL